MKTASEIKKALKARGLRVVTEKVPGLGGGHEYLVERLDDDSTVASGWELGRVTDALRAAYESVVRADR